MGARNADSNPAENRVLTQNRMNPKIRNFHFRPAENTFATRAACDPFEKKFFLRKGVFFYEGG